MKNKKLNQISRPICSVTALVKSLSLSRARFYQLLNEGIFPLPVYDLRTKRPFYDENLQDICHEIRRTGIGFNGQYIIFYSPRKTDFNKPAKRSRSNSKFKEIVQALGQMGLDVTYLEVEQAVGKIFADGIENKDKGIVIRELFRHFKNKL